MCWEGRGADATSLFKALSVFSTTYPAGFCSLPPPLVAPNSRHVLSASILPMAGCIDGCCRRNGASASPENLPILIKAAAVLFVGKGDLCWGAAGVKSAHLCQSTLVWWEQTVQGHCLKPLQALPESPVQLHVASSASYKLSR